MASLSMKALTFSADDETSLERAVMDALSDSVDLNMGIRRCAAFPATNTGAFLCELTSKETKSFIGKFSDKVKGRIFIDHAVIHLMYIPVILDTTHAVATLKIKNLATGDELYSGTRVNLNEAFILTMTWPRSLFSDTVHNHKGLYLGGSVECSTSIPGNAKIGMWYPLWSEKVSNRQLYQQTTDIVSTRALETFARTMIHSDKEMRGLLRSRASVDIAAKRKEKAVLCGSSVSLLEDQTTGIDFTVKRVEPEKIDSQPSDVISVLGTKMVPIERAASDDEQSSEMLERPVARGLLDA